MALISGMKTRAAGWGLLLEKRPSRELTGRLFLASAHSEVALARAVFTISATVPPPAHPWASRTCRALRLLHSEHAGSEEWGNEENK